LIIYVGSLRPAKVDGVREALSQIATVDATFQNADVRPIDVGDVAPRMPLTEAEVIAGARQRASAVADRARAEQATGWYAIGVEGGLDPVHVGYALRSWACVSDGQRSSYGAGPTLILPERVARDVLDGAELGDVIDRLAAAPVRGTRGAWGMLTSGLIGRRDNFRLAVVAAFAPFYNRMMYL
jgi:inosine/xanthosine triphosphatase